MVRFSKLVSGLTDFSPVAMRRESARWQIIWGADMRPQRRALSGRIFFSRRRISSLSRRRARVFITLPDATPWRGRYHAGPARGSFGTGELGRSSRGGPMGGPRPMIARSALVATLLVSGMLVIA